MSFWDDDARVERLKALWGEGLSAARVAVALGTETGTFVTRNMVLSKVHRLGLPLRGSYKDGHTKTRTASTSPPPRRVAPKFRTTDVPLDEPEALTIEGQRVTILNARFDHCRWPHGDPVDRSFHFCGHQKEVGSAYCPYHRRRSRGDGTRSERDAA